MKNKQLLLSGHARDLIIFLFLASCVSCKDHSGINRVWAVDESEKIKKEDITNPFATDPANAVWANNRINIFGAKNEITGFQIIIEAGKTGVSAVTLKISDLKNGTSVIPGSDEGPADPFDYRGRYTELFTEHYLNMVKRSPPAWFFSPNAVPSAYYTGWVPDCLIPFSAPEGKGGAPFTIEPEMNQGVWIDILIPRNTGAGIYTGDASILVSGRVWKKIPITLKVYDFTLPDSTHLKNMFGFSADYLSKRHEVKRGTDEYYKLELKYFQLAHRHRFDLVTGVDNLGDMTVNYSRYYTGKAYSELNSYSGPGINTGNNTFSIGYGGNLPAEYGGNMDKMNKTDWWKGSDLWEDWFENNAPGVERHKYLFPDEPDWKGPKGKLGTGSIDTIRMQANWTHTNPGKGKSIPCLVTNTVKPRLIGYVDYWSISAQEWNTDLTAEIVASERVKGHKFGIYNGFRPGMGAVVSDADAVEFRVMPWIVWKYNIDQYFYWSTTFWTDKNVFRNPLTYDNRINGDGTFLYPGQDSLFPEESRGLPGPLSSIRAKNWRRGEQDFEYLYLARKMGLGKEADLIVNECVPVAVWDAKDKHDVSWSSRGYKFEEYRRKLAELISSRPGK
jgi:hypothetical protein